MSYPVPKKPGFYWLKLKQALNRVEAIVIARVEGEAPFFRIYLAWFVGNDSGRSFERIPANEKEVQIAWHDIHQWGPEIQFPKEFFSDHQFPIPADIFSADHV